jgi:hypothetical protein
MPKHQIEFRDHFHAVASLPFGGMVWWYLSDTRDVNPRSDLTCGGVGKVLQQPEYHLFVFCWCVCIKLLVHYLRNSVL